MSVITISRQYGSRGDLIAREVCDELGLRYFDKRLMAEVAHEVGLSPGEIVDFSESSYKVRNFLDRLLRRPEQVPVAQVRSWTETTTGQKQPEVRQLDENQAVTLVQATIQAAYRQGNVVIVGRGGQVLLRGKPNVLHVRIEAPQEVRVENVAADEELTRSMAEPLVEERDRAAAGYLQRFYGVDWYEPWLYHMVLNTGKLSVEAATAVIVEAARHL